MLDTKLNNLISVTAQFTSPTMFVFKPFCLSSLKDKAAPIIKLLLTR